MKLLFVYNANSGKGNKFLDSLHKLIKPSSYSCDLCKLTFGLFSERKKWRDYRENLEMEVVFLHKDEFRKQYASKFGYKFRYPVILLERSGELEVFISDAEISDLDSVELLIGLMEKRLKMLS